MPLTCKSTTWKLPSKAKKGWIAIDCAGHGKSTLIRSPHLPRASSKRNDREIERRHGVFNSSRTDLLSHWTFENCPKLSSVGHFQSEQAFTPPTHFRTLFGFSEKFGNCRPPLRKRKYLNNQHMTYTYITVPSIHVTCTSTHIRAHSRMHTHTHTQTHTHPRLTHACVHIPTVIYKFHLQQNIR